MSHAVIREASGMDLLSLFLDTHSLSNLTTDERKGFLEILRTRYPNALEIESETRVRIRKHRRGQYSRLIGLLNLAGFKRRGQVYVYDQGK